MKRFKISSAILGLMGLAALTLVAATPAKAAFVVGGENGWQLSFDGMLNAFMVYSVTSTRPADAGADSSLLTIGPEARDRQTFRVRTGLLPSIFAFNVKSPTINGVDYAARVGIYPQINNATTRTGFGPDTLSSLNLGSRIDLREIFFTADGKFGQFLIGRALCLYQGKNILTDMTLIGVGVPAAELIGGGTTLGHIGYGYVYPTFNAQFRYTTPDISGFKAAFSINDPSRITNNVVNALPGYVADKTNQPRFEMEMSYAKKFGSVDLSTWVSALYQEAKCTADNHKVSSIGGAGGMQVGIGPVSFLVSGYGGKALGSTFLQDADALDAVGKERTQYGGLGQITYTIGAVKLGANYGLNYSARTDFERATLAPVLKSQQAATGGIYYSLNKYLTLVGEYTWARNSWYNINTTNPANNKGHQDVNAFSLGTVFVW